MRENFIQFVNVWWRGGSTLASLDFVRAFPEFNHIIFYRNEKGFNKDIAEDAAKLGVTLEFKAQLNKEVFKKYNPICVVMQNPAETCFEKDSLEYYEWVQDYPVVSYHRSFIQPIILTSLHIFNSNYTKKWYLEKYKGIKKHVVIPSCINTEYFEKIQGITQEKEDSFGIVLSEDKHKFSDEMINLVEDTARGMDCNLHIAGGLGRYQPRYEKTYCYEFFKDMRDFFSKISCLIYFSESCAWNKFPETWGRVVTEALASGCYVIGRNYGGITEQLKETSAGFLANNLDDVRFAMKNYYQELSKDMISEVAKNRAYRLASLDVMRARFYPFLLGGF